MYKLTIGVVAEAAITFLVHSTTPGLSSCKSGTAG